MRDVAVHRSDASEGDSGSETGSDSDSRARAGRASDADADADAAALAFESLGRNVGGDVEVVGRKRRAKGRPMRASAGDGERMTESGTDGEGDGWARRADGGSVRRTSARVIRPPARVRDAAFAYDDTVEDEAAAVVGLAKRSDGKGARKGTRVEDGELARVGASNEELATSNKKLSASQEDDLKDLEMAFELSLDCEALTDVERCFVPRGGGFRDEDFIAVRNALIVKFRAKPREYITALAAQDMFKKKFADLVVAVHRYLTTFGYINFGVMRRASMRFEELNQHQSDESGADVGTTQRAKKLSVVVIGAGMAGLAAAKHLSNLGHDVVVLEAGDRPGGRVDTREFAGPDGKMIPVDLGGSILSGSNGNPLCVIAKQLGLQSHVVQSECDLYDESGEQVDKDTDEAVETTFNHLLEKISQHRLTLDRDVANRSSFGKELERRVNSELSRHPSEFRTQAKDIYNWHIANLEFANASRARELSLMQWDHDDAYDFSGDHVVVRGGNVKFIEALAQGLRIWYGHRVTGVTRGESVGSTGVIIHCGASVDIVADVCIVTASLGVLKRDVINFVPGLPWQKLQSIQNLGFGVLNKVILVFPTVFWNAERDTFGFVQHSTCDRGRYFLTYSFDKEEGHNVLIALCAGDAGFEVELHDPTEVVADLMRYLRNTFQKNGVVVPDPISSYITRWRKEEDVYGSYSSCSRMTTGRDYDVMATPVGNIHFAGEATSRQYPATLHGAFLSGMREAGRIAMKCERMSALDKHGDITVGINNFEKFTNAIDWSSSSDLIETGKMKTRYMASAEPMIT